MKPNIKGKGKIVADVYVRTSVASISNGTFDNISADSIDRKLTLVGFDHDISTLTGSSATYIEWRNDDLINHMNDTSLLNRDAISLLSTEQAHDFFRIYILCY